MCVACSRNIGWRLRTYYGEKGVFNQNVCKACGRTIFSDIMNACFDCGVVRRYGYVTYDGLRFVVSEEVVRAAIKESSYTVYSYPRGVTEVVTDV